MHGSITLDPARPQDVKGTVRADLDTVKTGIERRNDDIQLGTDLVFVRQ